MADRCRRKARCSRSGTAIQPANGKAVLPEGGIDLEQHVQDMERAYIVAALDASGGRGTRAAELVRRA